MDMRALCKCKIIEIMIFNRNQVMNCIKSFRTIFNVMTPDKFDYNGYFVIVFSDLGEDYHKAVYRIFLDCWESYIANVVILVPTQDHTKILLYTFFPYSEQHCEEAHPILRNYFQNKSFALSLPHFPQKFLNFHQCPLLMSTYHVPPLMLLSGLENRTNSPDGVAGNLYKEISRKLNFTSIMKQIPGCAYYNFF